MNDPAVLDRRELGRATLARQLLLERSPLGAVEAVERLCGMQAQEPRPPFIGLWSRLAAFDADALRAALVSGEIVRGPLFRGTLHLASRRDFALLRAPVQPALSLAGAGALRGRTGGIRPERVAAEARRLVAAEPRTAGDLRALLKASFPDEDERALGYTARMHLPLVAVASEEDRWCFPRDPRFALPARGGRPGDAAAVVRRYLAAFGPASIADAQAFTGMPELRPAFEALGGELVTFAGESGRRELFDLAAAPRPGADAPAPVRFLPEFDSLVLAHADRSRFLDDADRGRLTTRNLRVNATVLVDGRVRATWSLVRRGRRASLAVAPFARLAAAARRAIADEGEALARAFEPEAASVAVEIG